MAARKKEYPPFLSEYLLEKAAPFLIYPHRAYTLDSKTRSLFDNFTRKLMDWRKTYQPKAIDTDVDVFGDSTMLDQVYTRDLLTAVPEYVKRTQCLKTMTLAGMQKSDAVAYVREAANCYIHGLYQASVALARSALELQLRARVAKLVGQQAASASDLNGLLERYGPRFLDKDGLRDAGSIRKAGNDVLHAGATTSERALAILEAARAVIFQLGPA